MKVIISKGIISRSVELGEFPYLLTVTNQDFWELNKASEAIDKLFLSFKCFHFQKKQKTFEQIFAKLLKIEFLLCLKLMLTLLKFQESILPFFFAS